jgi:hypothetical protein
MTKVTQAEREAFEDILKQDLGAINARFMNQIKDFWKIARREVMKEKGWDKLTEQKEKLEQIVEESKAKIHEIENKLNSEDLNPEQIVELGGQPNEYGRFKGANFYGIPVTSQFEYEIVEYIRERIDLNVPSKILRDVCRASLRELAMAGTFDEARKAYEKFYSLNFRKYGVDIPPRLEEITKDKRLLEHAGESLKQIEAPKKEDKEQRKGVS